MRFAIVDLETTGGQPKNDRIIEIGIVLMDGTEIVQTYESLVYPGRFIPPFVQSLTGIHSEMVESAPPFMDVAETVYELLEGRIFVAHNAPFDFGFLKVELARACCKWDPPRLCTVKLARKVFPGFPSYSLHSLIQSLGCSDFKHHRALGDAIAAAEILKLAINKVGENGITKEIKNLSASKVRTYIS